MPHWLDGTSPWTRFYHRVLGVSGCTSRHWYFVIRGSNRGQSDVLQCFRFPPLPASLLRGRYLDHQYVLPLDSLLLPCTVAVTLSSICSLSNSCWAGLRDSPTTFNFCTSRDRFIESRITISGYYYQHYYSGSKVAQQVKYPTPDQ